MHQPRWDLRQRVGWAWHHPRTAMALKAAVAATLAWLLALQLPGAAAEYPFYAPLGAVAAMYPTVAGSVRESLQGVVPIALGGVIAVTVDAVLGTGPFVIAVVVGLGVLVGGLRWLGGQRGYVPIGALFILIIGQGDELGYAATYAGLFLLGATLAVAINAAFPSLPVRQVDGSLAALRTALAGRLSHLADRFVEVDDGPHEDQTGADRSALARLTARARADIRQAEEATRGNRRARTAPGTVGSRTDVFQTLERVGLLVGDLDDLLDDRPWDRDVSRSTTSLRAPIVRALGALSAAVARLGEQSAEPEQRAAVDAAIGDLTRALRDRRADGVEDPHDGGAETLIIASIITTLRRCLAVITPPDLLTAAPT